METKLNLKALLAASAYVCQLNRGEIPEIALIKILYEAERSAITYSLYSITGDSFETHKKGPVSLSSSTQRFDSYVAFRFAESVNESVFAAKFDGEQSHEISPLYLTRILKEARMQLKGDLLREFGDCI